MRIIRGLSLGIWATWTAASLAGCADRDVTASDAIDEAGVTRAKACLESARTLAAGVLGPREEALLRSSGGFVAEYGAKPSALVSTVPLEASGNLTLRDPASGLAIGVRLVGASAAKGTTVDGLVVFPGGGPGDADVVIAMDRDRVEDFVTLRTRPAEERLRYALDLPPGAGLRLVGDVLEVLDHAGAPRLRANRPYAMGEGDRRADARLSVDGCAVDTSPSAPWGRAITSPGATTCTLVVDFSEADVGYPRVVDPAWAITTSGLTAGRSALAGASFVLDLDPLDAVPARGLLLATGGFDAAGNAVPTAELYEPLTRTFAVTGSMTTPRGDHAVTVIPGNQGKLLVTGGRPKDNSTQPTTSIELYDQQTGTFQVQPSLQTARHGHTATAYQDGLGQTKVLLAGGITTLGQPTKTAEIYDAGTASTYATGNLVFPRSNAASVWLDPALVTTAGLKGKVLVTGGKAFGNAIFDAELYDPTLDQFQIAVPNAAIGMKATRARAHHTLTLLDDGSVFLAGGRAGDNLDTGHHDGELFGATGFSGAVVELLTVRSGHTASRLPDGSLIFVGGNDAAGPVATTTIWGGPGATATAGATLASPRAYHIAGEVDQGLSFNAGSGVLVVGGMGTTGPLSTAEILTRPNGDGCALDAECQSGFCVTELLDPADPNGGTVSLCCDSSCDDLCRSCTAAGKGAGSDGACGFAAVGTDVGWQCVNEVEFFLECANVGTLKASELNDCKPGTCDNVGFRCNPDKSCATGQVVPCSDTGYCSPSGLPPESAIPADCTAAQPDVGTCLERGGIGSPCGHCYECESALTCVDGVCCTTDCGSNVTDPAQQITVQCQACNIAGAAGICIPTPAESAPVGTRPACDSDGTICGGACGGSGLSCMYAGPETTDCNPQTCDCGGAGCAVTRHACDGKGACIPAVTSCDGLVCDGADCKAACAAHADCTTGFLCNFGTGKCDALSGPTCDGDHTLIDPAGNATECAPYECDGGGCKKACGSIDDCVAPSVCSTDGKCVARIESPDVSVAGCSAAPRGRSESGLAGLGLALGLALLGARRRTSR